MDTHDLERPSHNANGESGDHPASHHHHHPAKRESNEAGRALLVGVLGGVASAVGYIVYSRLPPEQKERLQSQVRGAVESRIAQIRADLNL